MKKSDVEKSFIPITAMDQHKILNSGLNLVNIRTGNRFHSTRNIKLFDPNKHKRHWDVVMYAYNKVEDPRYFQGRNLEMSQIYLNPKYLFLLDICKDMIEVLEDEYMNFIKNMNVTQIAGWTNRYISKNPLVVSEFVVNDAKMAKFISFYNLPIIARKISNQVTFGYRYFVSSNYKTYLEEGYFNG